MVELAEVNKLINKERSPVLPLLNTIPPISSPFPKALPRGKTVELARVTIDLKCKLSGVLLYADINWSACFPGNVFTIGGWAESTFEMLRDGVVICQVHQSAIQGETDSVTLSPTLTVFRIAALRHLDTAPTHNKTGKVTYTLRATNIIAVDSQGETAEATKVHIGAATLTAQQIDACLPE